MPNPIACLCSDIHLSHKAPVARSAEPDWYAAMERSIKQVVKIADGLPIICAGDLFDRWNSPPELINWAIDSLPFMYCIPGQHDLPNHSYDEITKSAYWTLVKARRIRNTIPGALKIEGPLVLHPFPWGFDVTPPVKHESTKRCVHLAVIHAYAWTTHHSHPGAEDGASMGAWIKRLEGYDAAVFGDNHSHFTFEHKGINVINTGTLMRRKQDERKYQPHVGILYDDGHIDAVPLDCSEDKFIDIEPLRDVFESDGRIEQFLEHLRGLSAEEITFEEAVDRALVDVSPAAAQLVREVLGV